MCLLCTGSGELPPPPTEIGSMLAPQHFTAIPHPLVQVGQASPRPVTRASTRSDNPFDVHRLLDQHRFHQHHLAMQAAGLPLQALSMGPPPPLPFVPVGACPPVNVWLPPPPAPAAPLGHRFSSGELSGRVGGSGARRSSSWYFSDTQCDVSTMLPMVHVIASTSSIGEAIPISGP